MLVVIVLMLLSSLVWAALVVLSIGALVSAAVRSVVLQGHHRVRWIIAVVLALVGAGHQPGDDRRRPPVGRRPAARARSVGGRARGLRPARATCGSPAHPRCRGPLQHTEHRRAVLFLNPKSGGGKVGEFDLVAEAQARGVETVVLERDDDLTALAEAAVADGAEVLGMAGGDGSQADVAAVAVAHELPFVCIPAGTRNHFALDLNLDRADPRPALDAFVRGSRAPGRLRPGRRPLLREQRLARHLPPRRRRPRLPRGPDEGGGHDHPRAHGPGHSVAEPAVRLARRHPLRHRAGAAGVEQPVPRRSRRSTAPAVGCRSTGASSACWWSPPPIPSSWHAGPRRTTMGVADREGRGLRPVDRAVHPGRQR